ncbi:MAG: MFS transporter [Acidobacteriota bacterium]|nr:MFS transporter [Acidobacteriota bacterium]
MAIVAVALAGVGAFLHVYAPQPLLPLFEQIFHATKAEVGRTISSTALGVAVSAPLWGALAERVGRRRVIILANFLLAIPTILAATSGSLGQLVFWRFLQGLVVPGIFAVTIAYVTEEWPRTRAPQVLSFYVSGTVLGGVLGRAVIGIAAVHHLLPFVQPNWRNGFVAIGLFDLFFGFVLLRWLPRDSPLPANADRGSNLMRHFRNPQLISVFAVGFNVLFTLVAAFSYVTFYLVAPPFSLTATMLSATFCVYLVGLIVTPLGGMWISRVGSRRALVVAISTGVAGILMTLVPHIAVVLLGLAICCSGVFVCQSASTSYIQRVAQSGGRASAAGLYVMFYYAGGSVGGILPGILWRYGQWKACVALIVFVQVLSLTIAASCWKGRESPAGAEARKSPDVLNALPSSIALQELQEAPISRS